MLKFQISVNSSLIAQEINKLAQINKDDLFRKAKLIALDNQKREDLGAIGCLKQKEEKSKQKYFFLRNR